MNNFAKLVLDTTDECSFTSANHFDACNKQAHRGLCNRDIIDSPFGGLHTILCMDPLQHTYVGGGPIWYGEANSLQQAYLAFRQRETLRHNINFSELLVAHRCFNNLQPLLF